MIIKLTNHIKVIRPESKAMFPYSNSLYIEDDTDLLIDAGAGGRAYQEIATENVSLLLFSHYHLDHVHSRALFPNASNMAGIEEAKIYYGLLDYTQSTAFSFWNKLMGENIPKDNFNYPDDVLMTNNSKIAALDGAFSDGTVFNLGKTEVKAIHTPGHTIGHYAFLIEKEGIIFSSDLDLSPRGPWYGDEMADIDAIIESVKKIIEIKPAILVTSHRRIFYSQEDDIEKMFRSYLEIVLLREEKIINYLSQPRSIDDISEQDFVYEPGRFNSKIIYWNKVMVLKHLDRLMKMGLVKELDDGCFITV